MKRAIFVLYLFIIAILGLSDDIVEKIAETLSMTNTDVQSCMNKINVNIEDFMKVDQIVNDDVKIANIDNSVLKVGCLFACLLQNKEMMSGAHINVETIKKLARTKTPSLYPAQIAIQNQILDTCSDRVKSKTDECEVIVNFFLCIVRSLKEIYKRSN